MGKTVEQRIEENMKAIEASMRTCIGNECNILAKKLEEQKAELQSVKAQLAAYSAPNFGKEKDEIKECVGRECAIIRGEVQAATEQIGGVVMSQVEEKFADIERRNADIERRREIALRIAEKRKQMETAAKPAEVTPAPVAPAPVPVAPTPAPVTPAPVAPTPAEPIENDNEINCPTCEMKIDVTEIAVGQEFKCPHCREPLRREE